jgi:hypothetical protein
LGRRAASARARRVLLAAVVAVGLFEVAANVALSTTPSPQWTTAQLARFVDVQRSWSPGRLTVVRGSTLPDWAPAGELFAVGRCSGLYVSSGYSYATVPGQQLQHLTWLPVEQGPGIAHVIGFTFNVPPRQFHATVPLMRFGPATLVLEPDGRGEQRLRLDNSGAAPSVTWPPAVGWSFPVQPHVTYQIAVVTDPNLHSVQVTWYGLGMIGHYVAGTGPAVVETQTRRPGLPFPAVSVADLTAPPPPTALCDGLLRGD